jgi:glycosyltransferase involved in cell wall biosynthesis
MGADHPDKSPSVPLFQRGKVAHVSVCICTYQRPQLLAHLLTALRAQETGGLFTYSLVVADNDQRESARAIVSDYAAAAVPPIRYCVEPRQNIALARNTAIANATGEYVACIDDDEQPGPDWLLVLFTALQRYAADGVLGPVIPRFVAPPPEWIVRGMIFERPSPATGTWLHWKQTRTGNVLLRKAIFDDGAQFRAECGDGGEDVDFFQRMIANGRRFVWCAEALVHETVPPERCTRRYVLTRALRRGRAPTNQGWPVLTSLVAAPLYALALPALLLFGQPVFMRYLIKECDHLGRIIAFFGGKW